MKNTQQKIEIISTQESERIDSLIERIKEGDITPNIIINELEDRKKMINIINKINK